MNHRYFETGYGRACFRCGVFSHAIDEKTCDGRLFPNVAELELELAENWAARPSEEKQTLPYLKVTAFLAGRASARKESAPVPGYSLGLEPREKGGSDAV